MVWWSDGTPVSPHSCVGCEFVFEVDLEFDDWAYSNDDGSCTDLATDATYTYGYTDDYYGYGPMVLFYYNSYYYAWAYASFSSDDFTYVNGIKDYPYDYGGVYPDYYYTYYWYGAATVR